MWGKYWIFRGLVDSLPRGGGRLDNDGDGCVPFYDFRLLCFAGSCPYRVHSCANCYCRGGCGSPLPLYQKIANVCVFSAACLACPIMFFCGRVCDRYSPRCGVYIF